MAPTSLVIDRARHIRHGWRLEWFTVAWNSLEGLVAVIAGMLAGSVALTGFGIDSAIEVASGGILLWRLRSDADQHQREKIERVSLRLVGWCFLALATYVAYESLAQLATRAAPSRSITGIALACASLVVMPLLARAKRRVAAQISSAALRADAKQTEFCMYLSAILLGGLLLNALAGWWWADPLAGLIMTPIIALEGWRALRGDPCCH